MSALLIGVAVWLGALALRLRRVEPGIYLGANRKATTRRVPRGRAVPAGAIWGAGVGIIAGTAAPGRTAPLLILGTLGGALTARAAASTRLERRSRHLAQELPTIADTLALYVLAGESVAGAVRRVLGACRGVATAELATAAADPGGLEAGLRTAASGSSHPDAARLYELLGHAHRTGGRLAESLTELAADYRAALTVELAAEGGRRALASYGPILAFMIPVTLIFLMYPTLTGLSALSSTP
jgi:tight adherence protein C